MPRLKPLAALALAGLMATPALFAAETCREGDVVKLEDGRIGKVDSVGSIGSCFITMADGSTEARQPSQISIVGAPPPQYGPLKLGVYGCHSPQVGIRADVMIGLLKGGSYRHFDGGEGRYRYHPETLMLEITSGPIKGIRYRRIADTAFSVMEIGGEANTSTTCALNTAKSVGKRPW